MIECIHLNTVASRSLPVYMVSMYVAKGLEAEKKATGLIELSLKALDTSYRPVGKSYGIELFGLRIACESTNFDFQLLNTNDITEIDSIHSLLSQSNIKRIYRGNNLRIVAVNRDMTQTNSLYLYINNNSVYDTGPIAIELIYSSLQDRPF